MLFKPAWRSKNEKRALNAVERLSDETKLARAVRKAPYVSVQTAAVKKLVDILPPDSDTLCQIALSAGDSRVGLPTLQKLTSQKILEDIAHNALLTDIRILAALLRDDRPLTLSFLHTLASSNAVSPYAWLTSIEKRSMHEPLEEETLDIMIRLCGKTLYLSHDHDDELRRLAARILLSLYRKYKREDIRVYNGMCVYRKTKVREVHNDYDGCHVDSYSCNHIDSYESRSYLQDVRFNLDHPEEY